MNERVQFTQARIRALPAPTSGRKDYYDTKVPKLACRVSSTGNKSFVVVRWNGSRTQRITIGKFPEYSVTQAQEQAQSILASMNTGINPIEQKRKAAIAQASFRDVLEQCISSRTLKPSTAKDYRYKSHLGFSDWLDKPVNAITEQMVLKRHRDISAKHETTANNTMRVLRLTMNFAVAIGILNSNPADILRKARAWNDNNRTKRIIPSSMLLDWHQAVNQLKNRKARVFLFMALYMGARRGELLKLRWQDVSIELEKITFPDTKNGLDHELPIPSFIMHQLKDLHDETGDSAWVFAGAKPGKPMVTPAGPIRQVRQLSGVEFSPHDCRRTFATIAEAAGMPETMIKRLLNHVTSNDVTGGYIITEEHTLRGAINKIASYIQAYT